jgi:hypothetical protein
MDELQHVWTHYCMCEIYYLNPHGIHNQPWSDAKTKEYQKGQKLANRFIHLVIDSRGCE